MLVFTSCSLWTAPLCVWCVWQCYMAVVHSSPFPTPSSLAPSGTLSLHHSWKSSRCTGRERKGYTWTTASQVNICLFSFTDARIYSNDLTTNILCAALDKAFVLIRHLCDSYLLISYNMSNTVSWFTLSFMRLIARFLQDSLLDPYKAKIIIIVSRNTVYQFET